MKINFKYIVVGLIPVAFWYPLHVMAFCFLLDQLRREFF